MFLRFYDLELDVGERLASRPVHFTLEGDPPEFINKGTEWASKPFWTLRR